MRRGETGFTLVELLVALLVAAVVISMLSVSGAPSPQRALRFEADRLAQLLALAREEAQVRGAPIRFEFSADGYRFVILRDREWRPIDDDDLRPRYWDEPTRLTLQRAGGGATLEFGRDMIEPPYRLQLQRGESAATIVANGLGSFEVAQ